MYRRLAEVRSDDDVDKIRDELDDRYGEPPVEVASLLLVARFRARARQAGVSEVTVAGRNVRFAPVDLPESRVIRLNRLYPRSIYKQQVGTLLVPRPQTASAPQVIGGRPIDGVALLE
jgi:transcription-repair coupling factor (superfamily II helicase)